MSEDYAELTEDLSSLPTVLLVDDEASTESLVCDALRGVCRVIAVEDSESAIMAINAGIPDLAILDIEFQNGPDGFELCQQLRCMPDLAHMPIMFLSGRDEINDRVAGYDAGGDDYMIKPFSMRELKARVMRLIKDAQTHKELASSVSYASTTAMTAMSSMGEIGVLLQALKKFNASEDCQGVAVANIDTLRDYGLEGVIEVRGEDETLILSTQGEATPIEQAVIEKMVGMDRIFQFSKRLVITYDHVSLLISNLPLDDPDRVGRLRDHLAMLCEGADVRVEAIETARESKRRGEAIDYTLMRITEALKEIDLAQRKGRTWTSLVVTEMSDNISRALLNVALTEEQEDFLTSVIHAAIGSILDTHADESNVQDKLSSLINELKISCGKHGASGGGGSGLLWDEKYSVGHAILDEDHKTLIILTNRVVDALGMKNKVRIILAFSQLMDFSKEHFGREEDMLKRHGLHGLHGLNEHRAGHARSLKSIEVLQGQALENCDVDQSGAIEQIKTLVLNHILVGDKKLAQELAGPPA
jgi:hemerythrin-like metal-binding protein